MQSHDCGLQIALVAGLTVLLQFLTDQSLYFLHLLHVVLSDE
jgi:hypothetical protein